MAKRKKKEAPSNVVYLADYKKPSRKPQRNRQLSLPAREGIAAAIAAKLQEHYRFDDERMLLIANELTRVLQGIEARH